MILVVGAGPAGLATAYELQRRRLPYQVVERHAIGYAWQNHYDRLHLHTLKDVSCLPGLPMPSDYPDFPSAAQVQAYLQAYAHHFKLNVTTGVDVQHATSTERGWEVETNQGLLHSNLLMVATGIWSTPFTPPFEGRDSFAGTVMHSRDYRNPKPFEGQRVLVVGAGNSGSEIAVDLSEAGIETCICNKGGVKFVPHPGSATEMRLGAWLFGEILPRPLGDTIMAMGVRDFSHLGLPLPEGSLTDAYPVVGYALPEAVAAGKVKVYPPMKRFVANGVQFEDGQEASFDAVLLATGFRPTIHFVAHEVEVSRMGQPHLDRAWRSTRNRSLFCIGFRYPATSGWLQAIGRVAREAVNAIP